MELSFGESNTKLYVLCSSIWHIGSLNSVPKKVGGGGGGKLAFPFLWNSKPEALTRKSLLNTFADGRFNIVDIRTKTESLFIKQVQQLIKEHNARWTYLAMYCLGIHVKEHLVLFRLYPP